MICSLLERMRTGAKGAGFASMLLMLRRRWVLVAFTIGALALGGGLVVVLALTLALRDQGSPHLLDLGEPHPTAAPSTAGGIVVALNDEVAPERFRTNSVATVVDSSMGTILGQVKAGYRPWVLLRPSRGQLLVSGALAARGEEHPTLRIFDLTDLNAPPKRVPLPNRAVPIGYSPAMALSADERFLYYARFDSLCPKGGDTSVCDLLRMGIIDLVKEREVASPELRLGCGIPEIVPFNASGVLVRCEYRGESIVMIISPEGMVTEVGKFRPRYVDYERVAPISMGVTADGTPYLIYADGAVVLAGADSPTVTFLTSSGFELGRQTVSRLDDERLLLALRPLSEVGHPEPMVGLVIFDAADPASYQIIDTSLSFTHVAAVTGEQVALLTTDRTSLVLFDLETQWLVGSEITIPVGARWLIGD